VDPAETRSWGKHPITLMTAVEQAMLPAATVRQLP
jgi:hypothetical protein